MKTIPLGPWLGINNRLPDFALHVDQKGDYLAAADNVDIDNAGRIHSRRGTALLQAFANPPHSLYMFDATTGYVVLDSVLYPCTVGPDSVVLGTLIKVLASNEPLSYEILAGELYYSNGTDSGRISAGVWYPLGLPTPAAPAVSLIGGGLLTGKYLVAVGYCRKSGATLLEEGGISPYTSAERATTGGFRVTLPGTVAGATHINIYISACNGSLPYLLASVAVGTGTYDASALATGREASGRLESPLPAGTLFAHNGRLCSFAGNAICVGSPHRPGYYLPAEGRLHFPSPVSIAVSAQTGVFVAADKTYWIPGDMGNVQGQIVDVLPYGAVPGTVFSIPDRSDVGWFGAMGVVIANTQGQAAAVMNDNIDLTPPGAGNSVVFASDGYMRVVSCGWCLNLETNAATTYSEWDFTSLSGLYGTKADGIYLTDTTGLVDSLVNFGEKDFGTESLKYLPAVYAGASSDSPLELTVAYTDDRGNDCEHTFPARDCSPTIKIHRFDTARGMRSTWFGLSINNADGSPFVLASVSFAPIASNRKI